MASKHIYRGRWVGGAGSAGRCRSGARADEHRLHLHRRASSVDYAATWAPLPVGSPCLDGMGSTGYVGAGNPNRTVGMSTVCHFNAGPRAGQRQDYSATWAPLAVGTPCLDGMGSTGYVR